MVHFPIIISICASFGSILSAVQGLSSSQDFHGHRCVTLTFDPMTLKTFCAMSTRVMNIYAKFD